MEPYSLPIQILSGNIAGWAAISTSQPFDFLKTKYQLNEHVCLNSLKEMILKDGVTILYRGASSIYLFTGIAYSIELTAFQTIIHLMDKFNILQEKQNHIKKLMLTGSIVGVIGSFIYTPAQYTKIHTQMSKQDNPQGSFSRIMHLLKTQKLQGLNKLYTGLRWTLMRDVPGVSLYYGGFYSILYEICPNRQEAKLSQQLFASSMIALVYATLTYPFDTIKTNFQLRKTCWKGLIRDKFWKQQTFKRGFKATILRGLTMDTSALTTFENVRNYFYKKTNF